MRTAVDRSKRNMPDPKPSPLAGLRLEIHDRWKPEPSLCLASDASNCTPIADFYDHPLAHEAVELLIKILDAYYPDD